jgi:uncharacterized protein
MKIVLVAIIAAIIMAVGLILLGLVGDFLVDWAWFLALGYVSVFWTVFAAKAIVFVVAFTVSATFIWLNGSLAFRYSTGSIRIRPTSFDWQTTAPHPFIDLARTALQHVSWPTIVLVVAAFAALLIAAVEVHNWDLFLRYFYQVPYDYKDPLYGKDIGFYLFSLPIYIALKNWMLLTLISTSVFVVTIYWIQGDVEFDSQQGRFISRTVIAHGSALLALFFALKSWSYFLDRFLLLYNDNEVLVGASYTDIHITLRMLWILVGLASIAVIMCCVNLRVRTYKLPLAALALVFGASMVFTQVLPSIFQRMYVKPNELQLEKPYIQSNIALTQQAYNLDKIEIKSFPVEQNLSLETIEANKATINNIRLWDWHPLMDTYAQLQEIRTYYRFHDVDVDRHSLNGIYQQVTLSARELNSALLPSSAQTWVNRHILFTHGNGVIMSPVTRKSGEGLPIFFLENIPPVATGGPAIHEPRIYYGEETNTYVIVKGSAPEFDYPNGKDNVYRTYEGAGGVPVGGIARRFLFAWYFEDVNILISRYITGDSRIMFRRTVQERVRAIAPFLQLDHDPYIVISDGRLFWVQDAYTTSDYFPYARPLPNRGLNYIRNSIKVVIDVYNGSVNFYLVDPSDPIAATYQRIFPGLFKPFEAMRQELQRHIRYPEDVFIIQAQMYRAYHMDSPEVFYNREDLWQFPRQPDGENATMVPYYIILRLPGEPQAEFFLMLPMVPAQRHNMIAWLAARCDPPNYGRLVVYEFPKDKLIFGLFQIEARINQDTDISRQLSLWNQLGSRVIRGHLIVIPVEKSILYVSPLYLRAATGQLPELKRVIAAYGDRVVMEETLVQSLAALFREPSTVTPSPGVLAESSLTPGTEVDRARAALTHYERAMEMLRTGDWAGFGAQLNELRSLLEELSQHPNDRNQPGSNGGRAK